MAKKNKKGSRGAPSAKSAKSSAPAAPAAAEMEALESVAPPPYVPPRFVTVLALAVVVLAAGFFARQGFARVATVDGRLGETLLRVQAKQERPIDFDLPDAAGQSQSLNAISDAKKVVFINFWATWCPPCVEEMPSMRRLAERMADEPNFSLLAVSTDEDWGPVRKFFEKDPPPFEILLDASGKIARQYGTEKFPETYVIVDGELVGYVVGPRDWDTWYAEAYLRSLVRGGRNWGE